MKTLQFKDNEFFIILSDIHLEKKSTNYQNFIIEQINSLIEEYKNNNKTIYVLCAGDLHNSTHGFNFLSRINTHVFYVAGNHEYWGNDFIETQNKLKTYKSSNVTFLNNDLHITDNSIILGATLWSDLATNLNPSLLSHLDNKMNDQFEITINANPWTLEHILQENKKSWLFINTTCDIIQYLRNMYSLFYKNKKFSNTLLNDFLNDLHRFSTFDFLEQYKHFYKFSYHQENFPLIDSIFQKIKKDFLKPVITLSHHLPFYEEPLVFFHANKKADLIEDFLNIYDTKSGFIYNQNNYYYNIKDSYSYSMNKQIVKLGHYVNNGSKLASHNIYNTICAWVHGHEHTINHQNYVKGIFIASNPTIKNSLLVDLSKYPQLSIKQTILTQQTQLTIEDIKANLFQPFSHKNFLKPSVMEEHNLFSSLSNHDWDLQLTLLMKIQKSCSILSKGKNLKNKQIEINELMLDSLIYNKKQLDNLLRKLFINFSIQNSSNFDITEYKKINTHEYDFLYPLVIGNDLQTILIPSFYLFDTTAEHCFLLLNKAKQGINFTKKIKSILDSDLSSIEKMKKIKFLQKKFHTINNKNNLKNPND